MENASLVARQYRLQEWAQMIRDCQSRPSTMTVKDWCSQHQITKTNYYYRLHAVRTACLKALPSDSSEHQIVPVPASALSEASDSSWAGTPAAESYLELNVAGIMIRVNDRTSPALLANVLKVIADAE